MSNAVRASWLEWNWSRSPIICPLASSRYLTNRNQRQTKLPVIQIFSAFHSDASERIAPPKKRCRPRSPTLTDSDIRTVNVVKYNHTHKYCLSGGHDKTIRLWNPTTGALVKTYALHRQEVLGLDIAPDNATFTSCGQEKDVYLWDVSAGHVIRKFSGHYGRINVVKFSGSVSPGQKNSGSSVIFSGSFDAKVMVWDVRSQGRSPIQTLQESRDSVTSIDMSPGGADVVVGSVDGTVRTYDLRMGKKVEDVIAAPVTSVVISPSTPKETVLVASLDSKIRLMDRSNGQMLATFGGPEADGIEFENKSYRSQVAFGHGEASVMAGDDKGRLWVWDLVSAKKVVKDPPKIHEKVITWIEHHPTKADEMLTASADGTIKVWERKAKD